MCRILIISDHPLFAEGVERLISGESELNVIGVIPAGAALERIPEMHPDVVIFDAHRAAQSVFTQILRENPGLKFISLTLDDNDINIYYQRNKQSTGVETLVEAIREPLEWKLPERSKLRLLVITQGLYGQRIAENVRRQGPSHWIVEEWALPRMQPGEPQTCPPIPQGLPPYELILSLAESPIVARWLPEIVERTGAKGIIAPVDDAAWLPADLVSELQAQLQHRGTACVFPKPFCNLVEIKYNGNRGQADSENGPIHEFARYFGQPAVRISWNADTHSIGQVQVVRDSPCGCARYVAERLSNVSADQAQHQAQVLHRSFPCLASATLEDNCHDSLLTVSGRILQDALREQLEPFMSGRDYQRPTL